MKVGNKSALQSGRDRYTFKNYITTRIFPLISFFFCVINKVFKNMYNYQFTNYEIRPEKKKKNVKMCVMSFSSTFHGHMFISLKVISALQKNEKEGTRKK